MENLITKQEYMHRLSQKLASLPDAERKDALEYYEDYTNEAINAAGNEAVAISALPTPGEVAADILADYMARDAIGTSRSFKEKRRGMKIALAVIVGMFALPIGLPLVISMGVVVISLFIVLGSLIFTLVLAGGSLVISGALVVFTSAIVAFSSMSAGVLALGYGLLSIGIGILLIKLCGILFSGFTVIARCLSKKIINRRVRYNG